MRVWLQSFKFATAYCVAMLFVFSCSNGAYDYAVFNITGSPYTICVLRVGYGPSISMV